MGELRRQSEASEAIWSSPIAGNCYCSHNQRLQKEEVVGPEFRKPGEGWNHDRDEALTELSHKAERERKRNTLVFPLHTLQSLVIVSLVVHSN